MRTALPLLLLGSALLAADAGQTAPALDAVVWINLGKARPALRGKLTLVLFWAPDNIQSTMSFPELQDLHEVCDDVQVVTVCRDDAKKVREFLDGNDYTVAAGTDVGKAAATAYGLNGWPDTFLVDRAGKITWRGDPFHGSAEAWKAASGVEDRAGAAIQALAKAHRAKKKDEIRFRYSVLAEAGPPRFDLGKWTRTVAGQGAGDPKADASALLRAYVEGDDAALAKLRDVKEFNVKGWARARRTELFPLSVPELRELLAARRYRTLLDALVERTPAPLVGAVARDRGFATFCRERAEARLLYARKALMAYHWPLQGREPKDNKAFWREISVQSFQQGEGQKMTGIQIGSQYVDGMEMEAYALRSATQSLLMQAIGKGQVPEPGDLAKRGAAEVARILEELTAKYG